MRDDCELLEDDRRADERGALDAALSRDQAEREHEQQQRRRIGRAEPRRLHDQRIRREHGAEREPHAERSGKDERRR